MPNFINYGITAGQNYKEFDGNWPIFMICYTSQHAWRVINIGCFDGIIWIHEIKTLTTDICNRHLESCNMLFGKSSQTHACDLTDHMETRLKEVPLFAILTRNISSNFPPDFLSICEHNS